ncbi:MAG TPA: hypothetical protein DEQ20_10890 [Desulfobulbaceae bacterium]|nr:MAG: hypothetical protein A2520_05550 [Deltaproteobacteria bacterium RIFOXYD12_FULL_53_23]HCC55409.1 hypothetical protein [Desulfobulbaceae bacterium]
MRGFFGNQIMTSVLSTILGGLLLLTIVSPAMAESLSFQLETFADGHFSIENRGDERAYRPSIWQLASSGDWERLALEGDGPGEIAPLKKVRGLMLTSTTPNRTHPAYLRPFLVHVHDQAGAPIAQIAWPLPPRQATDRLETQHIGARLRIYAPSKTQASIRATYVLIVPDQGVAQLAYPLDTFTGLSRVVRHAWGVEPWFEVESGVGLAGAWLLHEEANSATEGLSLQIVPEGLLRGQTHQPFWVLVSIGKAILIFVGALAVVSLLLILLGLCLQRKKTVHE